MKDMKKRKIEGIIFIFTSFCFIMVGILMLIEKIQVYSLRINIKNGVSFYSDSKDSCNVEYDATQLLPMMSSDDTLYVNEDDILVYYNGVDTTQSDGKYMALSRGNKSAGNSKYIVQVDGDEEKAVNDKKNKASKFASNYMVEEEIVKVEDSEIAKLSQPSKDVENNNSPVIETTIADSGINKSVVTSNKNYRRNYKPVNKWTQNKNYRVGDKVTYNGSTYSCVQRHDSLSTWDPSLTPALWKKTS